MIGWLVRRSDVEGTGRSLIVVFILLFALTIEENCAKLELRKSACQI
jgi:hypothetical protein